MNKFWKAVIFHRFFFLFILVLAGCSRSESEKEWTILVYMAADNGLNENALEDIAEMQAAEFSAQVNVVVQIDHRNQNPINDYTGGERWQIFPNSKQLIKRMGEIDSGSSETLADFIDWGFSKFKSRKKALVLWSHGNGWYDLYNKFCPDKTSLTSINIPQKDLRNALAWANYNIDILIFDACNMQTIEVIAEVSDYAEYVISSEDEIKVSGFPYDDMLTNWESYGETNHLAVEIGKTFIDSYFPFGGSQNPHDGIFRFSCSVADTKKLPLLMDKIEDFTISHEIQPAILNAVRDACEEFNDPKIDIDIYQFFTLLQEHQPSVELEEMLALLDDVFIFNNAFYPSEDVLHLVPKGDELGFAALWFPDRILEFNTMMPEYENLLFQQKSNWSSFLEFYFSEEKNLSTVINNLNP
jgi:hypothetical protein